MITLALPAGLCEVVIILCLKSAKGCGTLNLGLG